MNPRPGTPSPAHLTDWTKRHAKQNHKAHLRYVVLLSDWTDENPTRVLAKLKKQSDYYNQHKRTVGDFIDDVSEMGWSAAVADRKMWAEMSRIANQIPECWR